MGNLKKTEDGKFWVPSDPIHVGETTNTTFFSTLGNHQRVQKVVGDYKYPGVVVSIFRTPADNERLVVFSTSPDTWGMLHVFAPGQMEPVDG